MITGIQEQPSTDTGWGSFLKTVSDYAKDTAETYRSVYDAFNPQTQDPNIILQQADASDGINYTPWLIGGGIFVAVILVVVLAAGK